MNVSPNILSRLLQLGIPLAFLSYCLVSVSLQRPKYNNGFERIEYEIYSFYTEENRLPDRDELSDESKSLLESNVGISYDLPTGLKYRYERAYPKNITIFGILSFGLVARDGERTVGTRLDPDTLMHNAKILAR